MELTVDGGLYASVTLPNLIVGTVGGGTSLPTQRECLEIMDCYGEGKAQKFSEICGAVVLAGELSIAAALSAGHFSMAHQKFGRKKK
jgi:hydroxymethylglutaryl-CoA reductase (NADPH)